MAEPPRAEIFSFEVETPDVAVLTYVVRGIRVHIGLSPRQVELLELTLPRVRRGMSPPDTLIEKPFT